MSNVVLIRAKLKKDYYFDGLQDFGYPVFIPYKDYNLFLRCCREAWFRLHLPFPSLWYNRAFVREEPELILVWDPLITAGYVRWLRERYPRARIVLWYENRAERTIHPDTIKGMNIETWSYDRDDCERYGMHWLPPGFFDRYRVRKTAQPDIDVLYVGRDKGRAERLLSLENKLRQLKLKTCFHICADRGFLFWKKPYYKRLLPYEDYLALLKRSKAILNIVPEGQTSITQRELEAAFNGVKCISNNAGILDLPLYDESRYFLLGQDNEADIPAFLARAYAPIEESELEPYKLANTLARVIRGVTASGAADHGKE